MLATEARNNFSTRVVALLVLPLIFLCGTSHAGVQRPVELSDSSTTEIITALREGQTAQALALIQARLRSSPGDCRLLSLEGVAFGALGSSPKSLQSFQHALTLCPAYLPALEGAAQIEFAAADASAAPLLQRILALQPSDATSHAMLASVFARSGECAGALPHFEASRILFATHPQLLSDFGVCLGKLDRWRDAVTVFSELVRSDPNDDATCSLANAQWQAGQPQDALTTLEPLLSQGTDESALVLGSSIAESAEDTARAVSLLRSAIVLKPDSVDNYLAFARLADAHKSFQVGIDLVDVGIQRMPDAAPLYVARGVLRVQLSQFDGAAADFEHAHQLDPKLSFAMDAIGILQEQQHESAASLALFRQQAALHPKDPLLQYLLAEGLSESAGSSLADAIAAAKRASALEPGYQPALDLLSNLYLRADQPSRAVQQAKLALAQDPDDTSALFVEIRAKRKLGDTAEMPELVQRLSTAEKLNAARNREASRLRLTDTGAAPH